MGEGDKIMMYVLDTSILIEISERYYPEVFPSLWDKINELILDDTIVSLKEVLKEIDKGKFSKQWGLINNQVGKKLFRDFEGDEMLELEKITNLDIYTEKFRVDLKEIYLLINKKTYTYNLYLIRIRI